MRVERLEAKARKFRASPERFFEDAKFPPLRALGRLVAPPMMRNELFRDLLEWPLDAVRARRPIALEALARQVDDGLAARRRQLLRDAGFPTVTVVMAARNAADTVESSIRSLHDQSYPHLDVVVVDDASEDGTAEVVAGLMQCSNQVTLLKNGEARGAARARNRGLLTAKGDYVTFQDADDRAHPERIERQLASLLRTGAMYSVCNFRRELPNGRRVEVNGRRFSKAVISMLYPREPVLSRVGFMRPLTVGEDSEYYERIRATYGRALEAHLFQTLYFARFSPDSLLFSHGTTHAHGGTVVYAQDPEMTRAFDEAMQHVHAGRVGARELFVPPEI